MINEAEPTKGRRTPRSINVRYIFKVKPNLHLQIKTLTYH